MFWPIRILYVTTFPYPKLNEGFLYKTWPDQISRKDMNYVHQSLVTINSFSPSAAYILQWIRSALVQIMAWCLVGAKQLSEPMLEYFMWTTRNKLQWDFNRNLYIFVQENAFENVVWKMAAISSRPQCVKTFSALRTGSNGSVPR